MDSDRNKKPADEPVTVIPVWQEEATVQKIKRESGTVTIHKTVEQRSEVIDQPLEAEEVEIERVPINRVVEGPVPIRYEGDTMIISLLEEVLVVEKRLLLREEVHVRKLHRDVHAPQEVLLRKERVEIEHTSSSDRSAEGSEQDTTRS